jgi:hypothetical protein
VNERALMEVHDHPNVLTRKVVLTAPPQSWLITRGDSETVLKLRTLATTVVVNFVEYEMHTVNTSPQSRRLSALAVEH